MSIVKKILWILPLMLLSLMATAQYSGGSYSGIDQVSLISSTSCSYTSAVSSSIYSGADGEGSALGSSIITLTSCVPRDTTIISLVYGGGNGAGDIQLASIITGLRCINDSAATSLIYGGGDYNGLDQLAIISATICTFPVSAGSIIYAGGSDTGSTSASSILGISCPYPTPVTTYAYSGGDGGGCSDTSSLTPCSADSFYATISAGAAASVCVGDILSLNVLVSGGNSPYLYQWYGDTTYLSGRTSSASTFSPTAAGTFNLYLNAIDNTGLVARDTITITANAISTRSISATICSGQSYLAGGVLRTSGGIYYDTLTNFRGCDSILTTNLTVTPGSTGRRTVTICSPNTFVAGGFAQSTSGTYYDTLRTAGSRGCDSILGTVLIVNPRATSSRSVTLCAPATYTAGGSVRSSSGIFYDTLIGRSYLGCDSILTTNLTINVRATASRSVNICSPATFVAGGSARSSSGTYYDTLRGRSSLGCDSILTTILTVNPRATGSRSVSICSPATFVAGGITRSTSGTYYDTLRAAASTGCDSVLTTVLTVNPRATGSRALSICAPTSIVLGGIARSTAGTYYDTLRAASYRGCDSILSTVLTIIPRATASRSLNICAPTSIVLGGIARSTSGTYYDTLRAASYRGCDSILSTVLTIIPRATASRAISICAPSSIVLGGIARSTAGTYYDTLRAASYRGCDSILSTVLTIIPRASASRSLSICAPTSIVLGGIARSTAGTYYDTLRAASYRGCDSILSTVLTIIPRPTSSRSISICSPATYLAGGVARSTSGTYYDTLFAASYRGCDSIVTTILTVNPRPTASRSLSICAPAAVVLGGIARTTSGAYYDTLVGRSYLGCDSILTTNLTVIPRATATRSVSICYPATYVAGGIARATSGTYYDTLHAAASSGCDSILTTVLTVNSRAAASRFITICAPATFTIGGIARSSSGSYYDTLRTASYSGCDSVLTTVLTVNPRATASRSITICAPNTYVAGGSARSTSGTYFDTLIGRSYLGCDSILTTNLTVNPRATATRSLSICAPSSIVLGGIARSVSGTYYDTLTSRSYLACDSILTTNLTVIPRATATRSVSICYPATYVAGGSSRSSSGTYYDTLRTASYTGCDSILTTLLTVNPRATASRAVSICFPATYVAGGIARSSSGTYYDTLRARSYLGCDSILTTVLTVNPRATRTQAVSICSPSTYYAGGALRGTSGTYYDTLRGRSYLGCDSILTTVLTVNSRGLYTRNVVICAPATYYAGGANRSTSGIYTDTLIGRSFNGCDSILVTNLNVGARAAGTRNVSICFPSSFTAGGAARSTSGIYFDTLRAASFNGCDSILRTNLTVNPRATASRTVDICFPATFVAGGIARSVSGSYFDTLRGRSYLGCDSLLNTLLVVHNKGAGSRDVSICYPATFTAGGIARSTSGAYYDTLRAASSYGCDSILRTNLTVNPRTSGTLNATNCGNRGWAFNGHIYTRTGTYFDTIRSYAGCDSIVRINLSVYPTYNDTIRRTIVYRDSTLFDGVWRSRANTYVATHVSIRGCDSITTLILTVTGTPPRLIRVIGKNIPSVVCNDTITDLEVYIPKLRRSSWKISKEAGSVTTLGRINWKSDFQGEARVDLSAILDDDQVIDTSFYITRYLVERPYFDYVTKDNTIQFFAKNTSGESTSWNFGDGNTSTELNPQHRYEKTGVYNVSLLVPNICGNGSYSKLVRFEPNQQQNNEPLAQLIPNPFSNNLSLQFSNCDGQSFEGTFISETGVILWKQIFKLDVNTKHCHFDITPYIEKLPAGYYSLQLKSAEEQFIIKVVKYE